MRIAVELCLGAAGVLLIVWALRADVPWFERHVLESFCVTAPDEPTRIAVARMVAAGVGALLLLVARPLLGRWSASVRVSELAMWMASFLCAVAAALTVTEVTLRRREARLSIEEQKRDEPRFRRDDRLTWRYEPSQTKAVERYGRAITYAIDIDGNRARSQDTVIDRSRPTLVIAGESTTFGINLPYDETLQGILERETNLQVINLSAPGYGNDQAYLRLLDVLPTLNKPVAVVFPVVNFQVPRNALVNQPHFEINDDGTLRLERAATGPAVWKVRNYITYEPYHGDRPLVMTGAIVRAADRAIRATGARPVFLVTNYGAPCIRSSGDLALEDVVKAQGITPIRVDIGREDWLDDLDRHPGPSGMRKLADAVERALSL